VRIWPFRSQTRNDELDQELRAHIALAAKDLEERGLTPEAALLRARKEFGNETAIREATRDVWGGSLVEELGQDLRYGLRGLKHNRGFTTVILLSLAIGIGANTAIFTLVDATLNRPLPFPEAERLVVITEENAAKGRTRDGAAPGNVLDWREARDVFKGLAGSYARSVVVSEEDNAEILIGAQVTADFFPVHGVAPQIGRTFAPEELEAGMDGAFGGAGAAGPVVISDRLWQRRFGGSTSILDKTISLDGATRRIVGVMPRSFVAAGAEAELWLPWNLPRAYARLKTVPRDFRFLQAIGRLEQGVTIEEAQKRLAALAANLARDYPSTNSGWSVAVKPLRAHLVGDTRSTLLALFGAVVLVLALMSANVANLQLARGAVREREMAVRQAIGVTRGRLIRQLLTESLLLCVMGGALGIALGTLMVRFLLVLAPPSIVAMNQVGVNGRVLIFTMTITLVVSLASGLWPALRTSRVGVAAAFRGTGTLGASPRLGARRLLVAAQAGLSLVLVAGALLLVQSVSALRGVDPGFSTENRLMVRVTLNTTKYDTGAKRIAYFDEVTTRLGALPGVIAVGGTTVLPMSRGGTDFNRPYWREDRPRPEAPTPIDVRMVLPGYFESMGIRVLRGRNISDRDREDSGDVVVINERFARQTWPGEDAVGKRVVLDYKGGAYPYEIVGVVNDTRYYGPRVEARPEVFIPYRQNAYPALFMVVHGTVEPESMVTAVREAVRMIDPRLPAHQIATVSSLVDDRMKSERLAAWLFGAMALIALVMSALGIWGVVEYTVAQTRREIGLRVAIGASSSAVLRGVLQGSLGLVALGLAFGCLLLWPLSRSLQSLLFGVSALDPLTVALSAFLMMTIALLASAAPARRAARVDPATALRAD
jgi:putative ABC transport system permease protein